MPKKPPPPERPGLPDAWSEGIGVAAVSAALAIVFWAGLWTGEGLIGGDVYTYFFPQKQYYAGQLKQGVIPLWNPLVGQGYPALAESQTGVLQPLHLLAYRTLDVNNAYNAVQLIHYLLAPIAVWLYARRMGLSHGAGLFAGMVYTYAWFPQRICLEWAILGAPYLPLGLWFVEGFLKTRHWRHLFWLSGLLAWHLLFGHFNLAFIELLVWGTYILARLWWLRRPDDEFNTTKGNRPRLLVALGLAIGLGLMLAAVQLVPTWELRGLSQRAADSPEFTPGYGHIPPLALSQIVAPYWWYSPSVNMDEALGRAAWGGIPQATNKIEAQLYFGMIPLLLAVVAPWIPALRGDRPRWLWFWAAAVLLAVAFTTGWPGRMLQWVPGFSFFAGPGRYGIVATLGVALWSGWALSRLSERLPKAGRIGLLVLCWGATLGEYSYISSIITNAFVVPNPPITYRPKSELRELLARSPVPVRLHAPGQNLPTLLGHSAIPEYLGIGPAAYRPAVEEKYVAELTAAGTSDERRAELRRWLRTEGVTHVLSMEPKTPEAWGAVSVWAGTDQFLNRAWGRQEHLYLYEVTDPLGRVYTTDLRPVTVHQWDQTANRVTAEIETAAAGEVIFAELAYPGWTATVDGKPAEILPHEKFRRLSLGAGRQTVVFTYQPRSVWIGAGLSAFAALVIAALAHVRFWHPTRWRWLDRRDPDVSLK